MFRNRFHAVVVLVIVAALVSLSLRFEFRSKLPFCSRPQPRSSSSTGAKNGPGDGVQHDAQAGDGERRRRPILEIVTAWSSNHVTESVLMLRSLSDANYTGPITIYMMRHHSENPRNSAQRIHTDLMKEYEYVLWQFQQQQQRTDGMEIEIFDYVVMEEYETYCFKPKVLDDYLQRRKRRRRQLPHVLMWCDTSTRFKRNPAIDASNMVRDGIGFAGKHSFPLRIQLDTADPQVLQNQWSMGMGENTHPATYRYLNVSIEDIKPFYELIATHFYVNLNHENIVQRVLQPWIDCASLACHTCMRPPEAAKEFQQKLWAMKGPPSTTYVQHRNDQSVLGILVYNYMLFQKDGSSTIRIHNTTYINVSDNKSKRANSIYDLLEG